ncbi:MAG: hydantoinase/oxoprolinase family protein, partial [Promethearchaeota archaeon]
MKLHILIGLDIGGVNIKCSSINLEKIEKLSAESYSTKSYFPLWKNVMKDLALKLQEIITHHIKIQEARASDHEKVVLIPGASITGELSDAFSSKCEGIEKITYALESAVFSLNKDDVQDMPEILEIKKPLYVASDGQLLDRKKSIKNYRLVSAANWYATAAWVSTFVENCILIDAGSTTTDIIPIVGGEPRTKGKTDLERLKSGELIYTGVLRSTIPSITHDVPINDEKVPI